MNSFPKTSYADCKYKIAAQQHMYSIANPKKVMALSGANVQDFLTRMDSYGVKKIRIYEKDPDIWRNYIEPQYSHLSIFNRDILDAPIIDGWFYDMDFCVTVKSCVEHIKKFKDTKFAYTFSTRLRFHDLNAKLQIFLGAMDEVMVSFSDMKSPEEFKLHLLITDKNTYNVYRYKDTQSMMVILKLS